MICNRKKINKFGSCSASVFPTGRVFSEIIGFGIVRRQSIRSLFGNQDTSLGTLPSLFGQSQRHGISDTMLQASKVFASHRTNGVPAWQGDFSKKPSKKPRGGDFSLPSCIARNFWCRTTFRRAGNLRMIRSSCGTTMICRSPCGATAPCTTNWGVFHFPKVRSTFTVPRGNNFPQSQ